jgi:carboxyl-terminal processing protease
MGNRSADHKSTTTDVRKLLRKLQEEKISGLILDLRRNGGGSLEEAIKLTGLFIPKGPVVQVKDFDGRVTVDSDTDEDVAYNGPLVVLVSRFSASASEILAAALQDYGRALLVGDISTHGKGTVQTVQEINRFLRTTNNLGALKFTIRKFYRINGSSTQLKGVTPDIVLPSFNNFGEIGEAALPRALPWDTIQSAEYEPMNLISTHLAELRKRSEARQSTDKDLVWLRGEIERHRKKVDDKTVSLNEQQRLNEKKEADARAEARKNELKRRGEPPYKTYEITLKLADQPGLPPPLSRTNTVASKEEKSAKSAEEADEDETKDEQTPAVDITLEETKRILMDLVELTARTKAVAQKP